MDGLDFANSLIDRLNNTSRIDYDKLSRDFTTNVINYFAKDLIHFYITNRCF